jgi:ribulose-5-phosphate 4-epimerase/fuculose-1-phosphate aldolase
MSNRACAQIRLVVALGCAMILFAGTIGSFAQSLQPQPGSMPSPAGPQSAEHADRGIIMDLVIASHILAQQGVLDGFGHVSIRSPASPQRFLMSRSLAPALVTTGDIMEYDLDGNPVDARGRASFLERFIHSEIYRARPDVNAVIHSHAPTVIPFSVSQVPLQPITHVAGFLPAHVPVFDTRPVVGMSNLLVNTPQLGKALAAILGPYSVVLMRGHGMAVVASTLPLAVYRAIYTAINARLEADAIALGGPVTFLEREEAEQADRLVDQTHLRAWDLWKREAIARDSAAGSIEK